MESVSGRTGYREGTPNGPDSECDCHQVYHREDRGAGMLALPFREPSLTLHF